MSFFFIFSDIVMQSVKLQEPMDPEMEEEIQTLLPQVKAVAAMKKSKAQEADSTAAENS